MTRDIANKKNVNKKNHNLREVDPQIRKEEAVPLFEPFNLFWRLGDFYGVNWNGLGDKERKGEKW
jgi:hypothetical protein